MQWLQGQKVEVTQLSNVLPSWVCMSIGLLSFSDCCCCWCRYCSSALHAWRYYYRVHCYALKSRVGTTQCDVVRDFAPFTASWWVNHVFCRTYGGIKLYCHINGVCDWYTTTIFNQTVNLAIFLPLGSGIVKWPWFICWFRCYVNCSFDYLIS